MRQAQYDQGIKSDGKKPPRLMPAVTHKEEKEIEGSKMIKEKYKQLFFSLQFGGIRTIMVHNSCASC
jgi:hypothetical protein